jgi:hypothetical protein
MDKGMIKLFTHELYVICEWGMGMSMALLYLHHPTHALPSFLVPFSHHGYLIVLGVYYFDFTWQNLTLLLFPPFILF